MSRTLALATRPAATFRHGVHPADRKAATAGRPVERMPFVDEYVLPLSQHTGAPSTPLVKPGQRVLRGQMIAKAAGFVSTALHAPVTGTVRALELRPHPTGKMLEAIVIRADPFASQVPEVSPPAAVDDMAPDDFVRLVQEAGIVGMGGAAFPAHVKYRVPPGKRVRFVILNGCECEPYLTCDHRVLLERPAPVVRGLEILLAVTKAERGYVGIEANKPDALAAMRQATAHDDRVHVVEVAVKYPQGAEKMLIDAVFRREVPSGRLPLDLEMLVNNVATSAALADLFATGLPLIERVVTVSGDGVRRPTNLLVPLGTPIAAVLDHCGGVSPEVRHVLLGGPMMGAAQKRLDVPVVKGTSGILALTSRAVHLLEEEPCIRCGRCLEACPMFLNPSRLAAMARAEELDGLGAHHVMDCFECASCSFVCPSAIPLVHWIRFGKALLREAKAKA